MTVLPHVAHVMVFRHTMASKELSRKKDVRKSAPVLGLAVRTLVSYLQEPSRERRVRSNQQHLLLLQSDLQDLGICYPMGFLQGIPLHDSYLPDSYTLCLRRYPIRFSRNDRRIIHPHTHHRHSARHSTVCHLGLRLGQIPTPILAKHSPDVEKNQQEILEGNAKIKSVTH